MVVVHPPAGRKPEVLRVVRLAFAVLASLVLSSVASAAERSPGTCLTLEGVWLAPWTDALDPACGADCGADDSEDDPLCTDEACFIEGVVTAPRMPAPSGPRCLEPGPSCGEGDGGVPAPAWLAGGSGAEVRPVVMPQRATGTLPGAGPPEHLSVYAHHFPSRESPPPRT
jgi:hypothetical protein